MLEENSRGVTCKRGPTDARVGSIWAARRAGLEPTKGDDFTAKTTFTSEEACSIGEQIGVDWATAPFDVEQFRMGIDVKLEHGLHDPQTDVTGSDPIVTGKIALAHLKEFPDYYTRLKKMELEAEQASLDVK